MDRVAIMSFRKPLKKSGKHGQTFGYKTINAAALGW